MPNLRTSLLSLSISFLCINGLAGASDRGNVAFQPDGMSWDDICEILKTENKSGFLYFTRDGCGPCKALEQNVFHDTEAVSFISAHFIPFWIESNNKAGNALFQKFGVHGTPTVVLVGSNGTLINTCVGYGGTVKDKAYVNRLKEAMLPEYSITALAERFEGNTGDPEAALKYAKGLMRTDEDKAIEIYENLVTRFTDPDIYSNLTDLYERKDTDRAVELLESGLEQNIFGDKHDVIRCQLLQLLTEKHYPDMEPQYEKALKILNQLPARVEEFSNYDKEKPNNTRLIQFYIQRAQNLKPFIYLKTGREQEGKEILGEKFRTFIDKRDIRSFSSLLYACELYGLYLTEAITWAKQAEDIVQNLSDANNQYEFYRHYAMILQIVQQFERAIEIQEIVTATERPDQTPNKQRLAVIYQQAGDDEKAQRLFAELIDAAGNDFWLYHTLADRCADSDVNLAPALMWEEKALALSTTESAKASRGYIFLTLLPSMLLDTYAKLLHKNGQLKKAIEIAAEAVEKSKYPSEKKRATMHLEHYRLALQ